MFKDRVLKWPFIVTAPLLAAGFAMSSFFTGTDTLWFAPPLVCIYMMAALVFAPGFRDGWAIPKTATVGLAVMFGLYVAVSAFWSTAPYISILFAFVLTALPVLFVVLICAPDRGFSVRGHMAALFVVLCGLAVWALIQFFFLYEIHGPRIHHPMLSPNNLAALFMIGLFTALGLLVRAEKTGAVLGAYGLVFLMLMALVVTQSRGGMIFSTVALAVFVLTLRRYPGLRWRKVGAVAGTAAFCLYTVNFFSKGYLAGNLSGLAVATQIHSMTDRLSLYESSLAILRDHFWGGIGLGTFYFTYPAYRKPIDFSDGYFAHMDPLQYGLEMGIIAPVLFYGVLIAVLWRTIRAVWRLPRESGLRVEIMAAFCAMLAVLIHTHIDFHLYILVSLIAMAVPLAWWYVATEEALGDTRVNIRPPQGPPLVWQGLMVVCLALLLNWPVRAALTTVHFPPAQKALDAGNFAEAEERLKAMQAYAPRNSYRIYQYLGRVG
ncbi:MAG: O-antigen ligase family protein, partial [Alphaproteobacteria bacterium]|nr:O-antigen ligase family protein [Alphaproteobacteria bacterium]